MLNWQEYIVSEKEVLQGKPIFKGTRLSVELILERLADGWTEVDILEKYPRLSPEALKAVYAYSYELIKESLLFPITLQRA
jgi:uncharacterized protein (DUF433 family)